MQMVLIGQETKRTHVNKPTIIRPSVLMGISLDVDRHVCFGLYIVCGLV